jgi:hypothetical protein
VGLSDCITYEVEGRFPTRQSTPKKAPVASTLVCSIEKAPMASQTVSQYQKAPMASNIVSQYQKAPMVSKTVSQKVRVAPKRQIPASQPMKVLVTPARQYPVPGSRASKRRRLMLQQTSASESGDMLKVTGDPNDNRGRDLVTLLDKLETEMTLIRRASNRAEELFSQIRQEVRTLL